MKQTVYNRKPGNVQGFFLVIGLVAALIAMNYLFETVVAGLIGFLAASICFWGVVIALGLWIFHEFVEAYSYELGEDVLRLNRAYGKRTRLIEDIYLSRLIFIGSPADAEAKNPGTGRVRAFHRKNPTPLTAVVYQTARGKRMALIQPDKRMLEALMAKMKEK